jgi:hypothetical protein
MRRPLPLHPFFLALLPALQLFTANRDAADPHELVRPILALEGLAGVALAAAWVLTRDATRAALIASTSVLALFLFPGVAGILHRLSGGPASAMVSIPPAVETPALVVCVGVAGMAAWLIARTRRPLQVVGSALNLFFGLWVGFMGVRAVMQLPGDAPLVIEPIGRAGAAAGDRAAAPHVFYVVLDAYGRSDVLARDMGVDNRAFLDALLRRGFYVASRSRSNYAQTALSLASSLNAIYLDEVAARVPEPARNRRLLNGLIERSRVLGYLRARGYRFVTFPPGASVAELHDADVRMANGAFLTELEHGLLALTAVPTALRLARTLPGGDAVPDQFELHRARVRWTLDHLADAARSDAPVFVLAHVLCPHPPFVFRADGSRPSLGTPARKFFFDGMTSGRRDAYAEGYGEQLAFLNARMESAIDRILAAAARPTIIVIQGDHGPGYAWMPDDGGKTDVRQRLAILNAYRFPDGDYRDLYPEITPVNTFRVILRQFFGADLPALPDRSFYSTWTAPFDFDDVTDRVVAE